MFRGESGVSYGFCFKVLGFVSALAVIAASADPADARARRGAKAHKSSVAKQRYSPPYAAIVIDANTGAILHESNPDSARHPASLTKIMTLYMLFEQLDAGQLRVDSELAVSAHAASMAPSKLGLKPGQTIRVDDAIRALVTKSANDVAAVVAEAIGETEPQFARQMTQKARALGMSRTTYRNASGLPDPDQITTARDQAQLGRAIQDRFPKYYRYFATPSFSYRGQAMRNHNKLLGHVNGVDGIKTGYTVASGFNLVTSVRRNGRYLVAVVMGGSSGRSRDARMRELVEAHITKGSSTRTAAIIKEGASENAPQVAVVNTPMAAVAAIAAPIMSAFTAPAVAAVTPAVAAAPPEPPATPSTRTSVPRREPLVTAAVPEAGSTDDIRPIPVRTVRVKSSSLQTASIGSAPTPAPATAEPAKPAAGVAKAALVAVIEKAEQAVIAPAVAKPVPAATPEQPAPPPRAASARVHNGWIIQVGALESKSEAKARLAAAQSKARGILANADAFTEEFVKGDKTYYRARFAGLDKDQAAAACKSLKRSEIVCIAVKN
jgi:D-alanyl-D-alanine carboxypeptidase